MKQIKLIQDDINLKPFENQITNRLDRFNNALEYINKKFGSIEQFASAHEQFGFHYDDEKKGWWFRECLPNAKKVHLIGDFNDWNPTINPLKKNDSGHWEIFIPEKETKIEIDSKYKILILGENGENARIAPYVRSVVQNPDYSFDGRITGKSNFFWTDEHFKFKPKTAPLIYEAHVGMAQEEGKVSSYKEFEQYTLPIIKNAGYNCVQLMAVMEHPYYGSFGYQVSNFFAPSSRFGTAEDLKSLINTAHSLDIAVILDVVHSHAVKNFDEGLTEIDGTELYFKGWHPDWDSRLFDYGKKEVTQFLLSNIKYWLEEFHFDGFRFDGVTSMLYHHHGHVNFNETKSYFTDVNEEALLYLQLANHLIKKIKPYSISICEDMSGMPGACIPIEEGGLGFDYRLNMGIPDFWINTLKNNSDESWHMGDLFYNLNNRRENEKNIAYCESHDQAMVGDKTIAFWLMDKDMYSGMSVFNSNLNVDRGIALHKLIRLVTISLGGEGYLNFIGNEFGHPEWVDFPREGNDWSHHYARRQWSLLATDHLKYKFLAAFDKALIEFATSYKILKAKQSTKIHEDNEKKILVFKKANLIFIFNFSHYTVDQFSLESNEDSKYKIVFSSDLEEFGGLNRYALNSVLKTKKKKLTLSLGFYSAVVLKKLDV